MPDSSELRVTRDSESLPAFAPGVAYCVADYGQRKWTVLDASTDATWELTAAEFARLDWMPHRQLVVEDCHLQSPRTEKSLAQVYVSDDLRAIYRLAEQKGIAIFMFPRFVAGTYTRAYRLAKGLPLDKKQGEDAVDCRALSQWVRLHPTQMHRPRFEMSNDTDARRAIYKFRDRTNVILNWARSQQYKTVGDEFVGTGPHGDECQRLLRRARLDNSLMLLRQLGIKDAKRRSHIANIIVGMSDTQRYTLAAMIVEPSGLLRVRSDTAGVPGVSWLMRHQVGNTGHHHRGGVARSNLYHHGMKNHCVHKRNGKNVPLYELSPNEWDMVRTGRRDYTKAIKLVLQLLRDSVEVPLTDQEVLFAD